LTIKLDALRVTVPTSKLDELEAVVTRYLGDICQDREQGGLYTYKLGKIWPTGAVLVWTEGRAECCLQFMGRDINVIPLEQLRPLIIDLAKLGAKGRRIDVALDDYTRTVLTVEQFIEAGRARNVTGCRRWEPKELLDLVTGEYLAHGCNFGVRGKDGSGRYVRVYDKLLESRGAIDAVRFELETAGDVAELLFAELADCDDDEVFKRKLRRVLAGAVDFRDRGQERNVDRMPRLSWWAAVVDALAEPLRMVAHHVTPALQSTLEYLRRSYSKTLAITRIVIQSAGFSTLTDLFETWADEAEPKIDWRRRGGRSLDVNFVALTT
jgi:hypothetical protein